MAFAELFFIYCFLPVCLILYFISKNIKYRNVVLIVFSLIFYTWGGEFFRVLLLLGKAALNYFLGLLLWKYEGKKQAKTVITIGIIFNIGMLFVFKYTGFFVSNLNTIFHLNLGVPNILLPIGVSFYTFKVISYLLDCYWGTVPAQFNFGRFLLYISLFPTVLAGPIVRYKAVEGEINQRNTSFEDIKDGITRIIMGLAKKVLLADMLIKIVTDFFGGDIAGLSVTATWFSVIIYSMYVYFDFSGYSDIAIGLGRIFGFHFAENFNYPFICKSIAEFWQRWHISLGTFFRDYLLYVPIFGKMRPYGGLFLVWFCTGLWHGASWNYVIWGLYFGVFIAVEQLLGKKRFNKIPVWIRHIYTKLVIVIGFGIFYFEDIGQLGNFFKNLVGANGNPFIDEITSNAFFNHIFLILAAVLCCFPLVSHIKKKIDQLNSFRLKVSFTTIGAVCSLALLIICSIMLSNATNHPFLYFKF